LKTKLNEDWWFGAEAFFQPTKNYLDPSIAESAHRSGWEQLARVYVSSAVPSPYWSPSLYLTGTLMRPTGTEFQGYRAGLDLANSMTVSSKVFIAQTLGLSSSWFPNRSLTQRSDQLISVALSSGYQMGEALALIAQLDYANNLSSDSNFRYNRWSGSLSGTYRF